MSILDKIVESVRERLPARKREVPIAELEQRPMFERERRDFYEALCTDELSIIAEIKKAAPSAGKIRAGGNPGAIAQQYERAGAAAISVLTEPERFGGAIEHLPFVRAHTALPLLRKDFIVDEYQLVEAKAYGADAVLLIATVLAPEQLRDLHQAATGLGLDALVEVYAPEELDEIDFDQVNLLGANNRDLNTFEIDLNQSIRVFRRAPDHVLRVTESGLSTADELATMRRCDVDAALIGTALMQAETPGDKLKELRDGVAEKLRRQQTVENRG
jgi:indole-3-glycerol phosphate synthase